MRFEPFDVVVVPFPYSDRLAEKRRPALVVSAAVLSERLGRVWVAMITSAVGEPGLGDAALQDLLAAGVPAPSFVRASKLAALDADCVHRRIGALSKADRETAASMLRLCAGF